MISLPSPVIRCPGVAAKIATIASLVSLVPHCAEANPAFAGRAASRIAQDEQSAVTLEEIRSRVATWRSRIKSVRIKYRIFNLARDSSRYVVFTVAARRGCRFLSMRHYHAGRLLGADSDCDVYLRPSLYEIYFPFRATYEFSVGRFLKEPYTSKITRQAYFEALGWWPPDDPSPPPAFLARPWFLHEILSLAAARVEAARQRVNGRPCDVVAIGNSDKLWIDSERGVLVRRERCDGTPPAPVMIYDLSAHEEVVDGGWLPRVILRTMPTKDIRARMIIDEMSVNDVTDAAMALEPRAGTFVIDRDTGATNQVPGGLDILDAVCARIDRILRSDAEPRGSLIPESPSSLPAAVVVVAAVCGALFGRAWGRQLARPRRHPT